MKIKVIFTNGKQRTFTLDTTFRDYQEFLHETQGGISELYFKEAVVPWREVLYLEEVPE